MKVNVRYRELFNSVSKRLLGQRIWILCLQVSMCLMMFMLILSWSDSLCVSLPILMWARKDTCAVWKNTNPSGRGRLSWWQRACLIEKAWDTLDYKCRDVRLMGNWPVCFDAPYSPVRKGKPCIVYSFGIAYDFRFDDAMALHNCTVFSFDPSMAVPDHQRGKNINFYKLGIGAMDNPNFVPRVDGYAKASDRWKVMTLSSIMNMFRHTPEMISLVKVDVEGNEWSVLKDWINAGIMGRLRQVLVEWHLFTDQPPRSHYDDLHADFIKFQQLGFKNFWMRNEGRNHWLPKMETQAETAWVNTNIKRKIKH